MARGRRRGQRDSRGRHLPNDRIGRHAGRAPDRPDAHAVRQTVGSFAGVVLASNNRTTLLGLLYMAPQFVNRAGLSVTASVSSTPGNCRRTGGRGPLSAPGMLLVGAAAKNTGTFTTSTGVQPDILEHYIRTNQPFDPTMAGTRSCSFISQPVAPRSPASPPGGTTVAEVVREVGRPLAASGDARVHAGDER